jgi:hypothetical protein
MQQLHGFDELRYDQGTIRQWKDGHNSYITELVRIIVFEFFD